MVSERFFDQIAGDGNPQSEIRNPKSYSFAASYFPSFVVILILPLLLTLMVVSPTFMSMDIS